jgi:hypothetical protein
MKLKVCQLNRSEFFKDLARVPQKYRFATNGRAIPEGRICEVSIGGRSALISLRGQTETDNPEIQIDGKTRNRLGVELDSELEVQFKEAGLLGQFTWARRSSDPAYMLASNFALLSIGLSLVGIVLGLAGLGFGVISLIVASRR